MYLEHKKHSMNAVFNFFFLVLWRAQIYYHPFLFILRYLEVWISVSWYLFNDWLHSYLYSNIPGSSYDYYFSWNLFSLLLFCAYFSINMLSKQDKKLWLQSSIILACLLKKRALVRISNAFSLLFWRIKFKFKTFSEKLQIIVSSRYTSFVCLICHYINS